jgi:hypothetical protein
MAATSSICTVMGSSITKHKREEKEKKDRTDRKKNMGALYWTETHIHAPDARRGSCKCYCSIGRTQQMPIIGRLRVQTDLLAWSVARPSNCTPATRPPSLATCCRRTRYLVEPLARAAEGWKAVAAPAGFHWPSSALLQRVCGSSQHPPAPLPALAQRPQGSRGVLSSGTRHGPPTQRPS